METTIKGDTKMQATQETIYEAAKETAKKIRKELKKNFPGQKFSVTSMEYSGGNSVHVDWVDGPQLKKVQEVTSKFSSASFDGMVDLKTTHGYEYKGKLYCGADYILAQRSFSPERRAMLEELAGVDENSCDYCRLIHEAEETLINK